MATRRRRTGLLFSSAVVLGLVGGAGTGYQVQKQRQPTPLPGLSSVVQTGAPAPEDLADDDVTKLDGDIRTLLLARPAGAKDWPFDPAPTGWSSLDELVLDWTGDEQAAQLVNLNSDGFRRVAERTWTTADGDDVEVRLIQFHTSSGAQAFFGGGGVSITDTPLAGTQSGYIYVFPDSNASNGGFVSVAQARHGTVVMQIYVTYPKQHPPTSVLEALAKQQLEKL